MMAEDDIVVPSTVVLPEVVDEAGTSPTQTNKRRASSTSSSGSKRQRLGSNDTSPVETKSASSKRGAADVDERKRGKRLFGGLLGTLSQNSSSTAQRRRVDIERKQREKLKAQNEENEEVKRLRQKEIDVARKAKQKIWDVESRHTKHENERALARFLKTKTRPMLYYKPWELRSEEEDLIKQQIEEVERRLQMEESEKEHILQASEDGHMAEQQQDWQVSEDINMDDNENGPPDEKPDKAGISQTPRLENGQPLTANNIRSNNDVEDSINSSRSPKQGELIANGNHASPDALKDGMEEVVQGDEDAVLY